MTISFAKFSKIAGATAVLLASSAEAEDLTLPEAQPILRPLPAGPSPVQPVGQPTVGGVPFVKPVNFRGSADLRDVTDGKEYVPRERHWQLLLGVTIGFDYDDNIFLAPNGSKQHDFIFAIAPSLGIQFGDPSTAINFLTFTYTPTFVIFADNSNQNSVDEAVDLAFQRQSDIWKLSGNFDFEALNGGNNPLRTAGGGIAGEQVGERVSRQVYTLGVRYNYTLSEKTSLEIGLSGNYTHYQSFLSTVNVVNQNYIDYAITGKTSIGLGFGIGYENTEGSPNQIYEQALARVRYYATSKLSFELHGGGEFLQTGGGGGSQVNGVFGASVIYALSDRTSFSLTGYRNINPSSAEANTNYVVTGVLLSASQKILGKVTAALQVGYENSEYHTFSGSSGVARTDNYFYVHPSLQYPVGHSGVIELFYDYRINDSTDELFQFADNRAGLKFSFAF